MKKPLGISLLVGLLALAFAALPAMAAAQPVFEGPGGPLKEGESVSAQQQATNPVVTHTALGTLECNKINLSGEVTNGSSDAIAGGGEANECQASGSEVVITSIEFTDQLEEGETAESGPDIGFLRFVFDIPALGAECHLEGPVLTTWTSNSPVIVIDPSVLTGGGNSPFCPAEGTIEGGLELLEGVTVQG